MRCGTEKDGYLHTLVYDCMQHNLGFGWAPRGGSGSNPLHRKRVLVVAIYGSCSSYFIPTYKRAQELNSEDAEVCFEGVKLKMKSSKFIF